MADDFDNDDDGSSYELDAEGNLGWIGTMSDEEETLPNAFQWTAAADLPTVVTFDQATDEAWETAKREIKVVRSNLKALLGLDDDFSDFSLFGLFDLHFGSNSRLWIVIDEALNGGGIYHASDPLTHDRFLKIMGSFFCASSFGLSATALWSEPLINTKDFCSYEEYTLFWKNLTKADHEKRYDSSIEYTWMKILDVINQTCRIIFLRNWEPYQQKCVTIDDDKVHYNGKMGHYKTAGLKPTQLVRDNRRGFVFHTLVFTASGCPLGVEAELITDVSSLDTSSRLITKQLCPNHRSNSIPNLSNVVLFADRLYWTKDFLYNFILPSGADIGPCTHKRCHDFPFTFEQKLTRNDTRTLLTKKGTKCVFIMERQVGMNELSAIAYRDGHGKIALGIASGLCRITCKHWDFHLKFPADRYRLLEDDGDWINSKDTWIRNLTDASSSLSLLFLDLFDDQECRVDPLTTGGSEDQAWFLARSFSFTSSTTDAVINKVVDLATKGEDLGDNMFIFNLNIIMKYIGKPFIPLLEVVDDNVDTEDSSSIGTDSDTDVIQDGCNLSQYLRDLKMDDPVTTSAFLVMLSQPSRFSNECCRKFLEMIGMEKPTKIRKSNEAKIREWVEATPIEKRQYMFLRKDQLVNICVTELNGSKTFYSQKKALELIELLSAPRINTDDANRSSPAQQSLGLSGSLTKFMVEKAMLKPLSGDSRQATRIGLENEEALLHRLMEESKSQQVLLPNERNQVELMQVIEIYRPGLVQKASQVYVKTSIDALAVLQKENGGHQLVGIEVKTRTNDTTRKPEISLRMSLHLSKMFVNIPYSEAKRFIPKTHELIQLLHHAYVYNLSMVLLLIGDTKGSIIRGVWVSFEQPIFDAYCNVLHKCYDISLKWAYENQDNENDEISLNQVRSSLPSFIDFENFKDYYNLWKCAVSSEHSILPLPPTEYIIPFHFSKWNKFKGGSDTLTKLFWNSKHYVPSDSPAAYAISRLLRLMAAVVYRCDAIMSSNKNLSVYASLLHWRNANNQRQRSFDHFLRHTARLYFFQNQSGQESPPSSPSEQRLVRNSRHRDNQIPISWVTAYTGKTPSKNVKQQYEENKETLDLKVVERRERCTCYCVFRVAIDKDGNESLTGEGTTNRCAVCKKNTRYYCANCHTWLCGPGSAYLDQHNKKTICVYKDAKTGREIRFRQSCFQIYHDQGLSQVKENSLHEI